MDALQKLAVLGQAEEDRCGPCTHTGATPRRDASPLGGIAHCALPNGGSLPVLRVLFTNHCERDCAYCVHNRKMDTPRLAFRPEELVRLFGTLQRNAGVKGLFLTSGITRNPDALTERMVDCVVQLRRRGFRGYVHLKVMPGASEAAVEAAMAVATRVSINLEAPSASRLGRLSTTKSFHEILATMQKIQALQGAHPHWVPGGQVTQFVVGGAGEPDGEILDVVARLYQGLGLKRVYYSAFNPVPGTALEDHVPTPPLREHRLYQADWLLRKYGFNREELILDPEGNLPLAADPKLAWALHHPERFPVEVNTALERELLRVPGIGPVSANRIMTLRSTTKLRDIKDLRRLGVATSRAQGFLLLDGKSPARGEKGHRQLSLPWEEGAKAHAGISRARA